MLSALGHYVAEPQHNWDLYSDALTFGYNTNLNPNAAHFLFELGLANAPNLFVQPLLGSLREENLGGLRCNY